MAQFLSQKYDTLGFMITVTVRVSILLSIMGPMHRLETSGSYHTKQIEALVE